MELSQRVAQLAQAIGADIGTLSDNIGNVAGLGTMVKSDVVSAVNELVDRVDQGTAIYEHQQSSPSTSWTVNHNLNHRPNVTVLSSGGVEVWAEVIHASLNQVMVYFDQPTTGTVICK